MVRTAGSCYHSNCGILNSSYLISLAFWDVVYETIVIVESGNHKGVHQHFQSIERKVLSNTTN